MRILFLSLSSKVSKSQICLLDNYANMVNIMPADALAEKPTGHMQV